MKKSMYLALGFLYLLLFVLPSTTVQAKTEPKSIEINGVIYNESIESEDDTDVNSESVESTNSTSVSEEITEDETINNSELQSLKSTIVGMEKSEIKTMLSKYLVDPNIKLTAMDLQKVAILEDELDKSFTQRSWEDSKAETIALFILLGVIVIVVIGIFIYIVTEG